MAPPPACARLRARSASPWSSSSSRCDPARGRSCRLVGTDDGDGEDQRPDAGAQQPPDRGAGNRRQARHRPPPGACNGTTTPVTTSTGDAAHVLLARPRDAVPPAAGLLPADGTGSSTRAFATSSNTNGPPWTIPALGPWVKQVGSVSTPRRSPTWTRTAAATTASSVASANVTLTVAPSQGPRRSELRQSNQHPAEDADMHRDTSSGQGTDGKRVGARRVPRGGPRPALRQPHRRRARRRVTERARRDERRGLPGSRGGDQRLPVEAARRQPVLPPRRRGRRVHAAGRRAAQRRLDRDASTPDRLALRDDWTYPNGKNNWRSSATGTSTTSRSPDRRRPTRASTSSRRAGSRAPTAPYRVLEERVRPASSPTSR